VIEDNAQKVKGLRGSGGAGRGMAEGFLRVIQVGSGRAQIQSL
jgi:hypothetical protein